MPASKNITIHPYVTFIQTPNITLKDNIIISEYCWIQGGIKLVIGNFVHIGSHVSIGGGGVCLIEDFATVSAGSRILAGTDLALGEGLVDSTIPAEYRAVSRSFVHIEKYAFITTNVVVHPGVTIGEGAVIGSNSVVTKDIEPWTINVGSPAKPIKTRPSKEIKRLGKILYKEKEVSPLDVSEFLYLKKTTESLPIV
jgi:galactoside O-acetyltransferase